MRSAGKEANVLWWSRIVAIDVYLCFEHAAFVQKNNFRFRLLQAELIADYFYNRRRKANMILSYNCANTIYWHIEYSLWTGDARRAKKNLQNLNT